MMEKVRIALSKVALTAAFLAAPGYMRRVLAYAMESATGVCEEIAAGRDGGVMITPWFTSAAGGILANTQAHYCLNEAKRVRAWHAGQEPRPC